MFFEEARISASLNHPNVVQVYEVGGDERECFLAMELLRGRSYAHLPLSEAADVLDYRVALEVMLGTHYDRTPAPPQTLTLDQPTFEHIGLHSGVRATAGRYRFGASYTHYWYDIPSVTNSITLPPANFKGTGQNNILAVSIEAQR